METKQVLTQQWTEAPTAAPLVKRQDYPCYDFGLMDFSRNSDRLAYVQMVLVDVLGEPVEQFRAIDSQGEVAIIQFVPYKKPDPIMPITPYVLGWEHDAPFRALARLQRDWSPKINQHQWYSQAKAKANELASFMWVVLNEADYAFYRRVLNTAVTMPHLAHATNINTRPRVANTNTQPRVVNTGETYPQYLNRKWSRENGS